MSSVEFPSKITAISESPSEVGTHGDSDRAISGRQSSQSRCMGHMISADAQPYVFVTPTRLKAILVFYLCS